MSTATKRNSGGGKQAAARAERNGKPKSATFRGIKLVLPSKLGSDVAYAYAELETSENSIGPFIGFVRSLIGPEQMAAVKAKQAEDEVSFDNVAEDLDELIAAVFAAYGTDKGESSASASS